jgi:hypothetical protein
MELIGATPGSNDAGMVGIVIEVLRATAVGRSYAIVEAV